MTGHRAFRRPAVAIALLVAAYAVVYLVNLGTRPMASKDEFRYAEIAREMLVAHDWITPHLNGLRYFEKPIMGHWVEAASLALFGQTTFASRLPSALATGATALFIGLLAFRMSRDRRTAVLAVFIYLTILAVFVIGTINILDPQFTLWVTLAIGIYYLALQESLAGRRMALQALAGAACGFAFLTKGFLALALPVIVILPYLAWQRRWRELLTGACLPLVVAAGVALPWSLLILKAEPDFWHYFFWDEHIRRFAASDAQHAKPIWLFVAALPAMALPWTCLLPAALGRLANASRDGTGRDQSDHAKPDHEGAGRYRALLRFMALWCLLPLLFFSIARGKLLTYILPCFPPLAILMALGLAVQPDDARSRWVGNGLRALAGLWVICLVFLLANGPGGIGRPIFDDTESTRWLSLVIAFGAGLVVCLLALRQRSAHWRIWIPGLVVLPLLLAIPFAIPNGTRATKMPGEMLAVIARNLPPDALVITDGVFVQAVDWTLKRSDAYLLSPGELEYGLGYPDGRSRLLDAAGLQALLDEARGHRAMLIVCDVEREPLVATALRKSHLTRAAYRIDHGDMVAWSIVPAPDRQPVVPPPAVTH